MARPTLQHDVLDSIGRQIVGGTHTPGTILRTEDLETTHDASRTVVREALKVLESMGLVKIRRRIGVIVLPADAWSLFDPRIIRWRLSGPDRSTQLRSLVELRTGIEPIAAQKAAINATQEQRDQLVELARNLEQAGARGDRSQYLAYDISFHTLLLQASGNEMFASLSDVVAEILTGRKTNHLSPDQPTLESRHLHQLVATSIARADAAASEAAMRNILSEVAQQVAVLSGGGEDAAGRTPSGRP